MTESNPERSGSDRQMADRTGWLRWLPGLQTLRRYEAPWLPHDLVAGSVLATMLVPVGIAYAVASGLPGIYGLYATIIPLLVYCVVRAQPHPGPGAGLVAGGCHPERRASVIRRGPPARCDAGRHAGDRFGDGMHPDGGRAPGFCYRAYFQADTVRLHERNCAHRINQPTTRAFRLLNRERRTLAGLTGDRRRDTGGTNELGGSCARGKHAGSDPASPGQQTRAGHSGCGGRCDRNRWIAGPRDAL